MTDFYPVITEDGTLSLYNTKINDIYHSKIGAYTEALNKFTLPSGILDYAQNNNYIRILDICYGLGYNSRVAVSEVLKINPKCKIHVTGIDIDPNVLAYSYFARFNKENIHSYRGFTRTILTNLYIRRLVTKFKNNVRFLYKNNHNLKPQYARFKKAGVQFIINKDFNSILHNIYYGSVSGRNNKCHIVKYSNNMLDIVLFINDLRKQVMSLKEPYDFIFHDPFTPSIVPSLWSVNLFRELYRLLKSNGTLTTYTSSAAVRSGLIEAGFYIDKTEPIGRKSSGTLAYKDNSKNITQLSTKERGLLNTNAGIPYYDEGLIHSDNEILKHREVLIKESGRLSTSQYLKSIQ